MRIEIRNGVLTRMSVVEDTTGLNRKTIINLALYHGIEAIYEGYVPRIREQTNEEIEREGRTKISVNITDKMKEELEEAVHFYLYKKRIKYDEIPKTEYMKRGFKRKIIETLIDVEIKKLERLCSLNQEYEQNEGKYEFDELNIRIRVPYGLKDRLMELEDELGISRNQLQQYIFLNGFQDSENNISPLILENDEELVDFIKSLNIDIVKGLALVDYVLRLKYR